ncbi:MAG: CubicO group peptidase (beta-lactamase class C family) [Myxococcota bacterium]|jgi:CubicO group peptidase (beta-lactamase class C family)
MTDGTVALGFEGVRSAFEANFQQRGEIGAALCVYHHGERVVDLWGGQSNRDAGTAWHGDTLSVAFSCTKGLVALMFTMLADRGELVLDAPIARYWPEFDVHGKGAITVRQWLNHRSGLSAIDAPLTLDDFTLPVKVEAACVAQKPLWSPGAHQGYAATAFGAFAQALFRRVARRSLGTFLQEEVAGPLGVDAFIGMPPERDAEVATLYPYGRRTLLGRVVPELLTRRTPEGRVFRRVAIRRRSPAGRAFLNPDMGRERFHLLNKPEYRRIELPWMNGVFSARALATIYSALANGGSQGGVQLVTPAAIDPLTRRQSWSQRDRVLNKPLGFSQGFCKDELHLFSPNVEAFGHSGVGGSVGFADPRTGLSVAYIMNRLDWRLRSPRAITLCHAIYSAIGQPFPA